MSTIAKTEIPEKESLKMRHRITKAFGDCYWNEFPKSITALEIYYLLVDLEDEVTRLSSKIELKEEVIIRLADKLADRHLLINDILELIQ